MPQLTLPYHFEGPLLCRKLAEHGAGLTVHSDFATGHSVRENLLRLLNESAFQHCATQLRDEMIDLPTPNHLVGQLEELTTKLRAR